MRTAPLSLPGSFGDLYDRITILEIKAVRLRDPDKRRNVSRELALLRAVEPHDLAEDAALLPLVAELKAINETLWDLEEVVRDHERREDFGPAFIESARAIYRNNDRRAATKKRLNLLCGSPIVEEKSHGG